MSTPASSASYLDLVGQTAPLFAAALQAHREGKINQARMTYLEMMDQPVLIAPCLHQLGVIAGQIGDHPKAIELLRRAVRLDEQQSLYYQNLAVALDRAGQPAQALDALVNLGVVLQSRELHAEAVPIYEEVMKRDKLRYAAHVNLGTAMAVLGKHREAADLLIRGVALYGVALAEAREYLEAVKPELVAAGTIAADAFVPPGNPTDRLEKLDHVLSSLGKTLSDLAHPRAAVTTYRAALKISPGLPLAHWNLSLSLLSLNDFENGWAEYMWRWHWDRFPEPQRLLAAPVWRGESLAGKTIGVYGEQGYGDIIQFSPLALHLAKIAGKVVLEVSTPLVRLLRQSYEPHGVTVIGRTDFPNKFESPVPLDYVVPLMSLPHLLDLRPEKLPIAESYLVPDPKDVAAWEERFKDLPHPRTGVVWAGRPAYAEDAKRSIAFERFRPILATPDRSWVSLQVGPRAGEAIAAGLPVYDCSPHLKDFADTAAAISQLDQVVAVDTGVAHLAAALGKPTWILIPRVPDWRWLLEREDTNWYRSVRLFRQPAIGDWETPIRNACEALVAKPVKATRSRARRELVGAGGQDAEA